MRSAIAVLMLALALGLAGSATAAEVTLNDSTLVYSAGVGVQNQLTVDPDHAGNVIFSDPDETITTSVAGCSGGGTPTVVCPLAGLTAITVLLFDDNDAFHTTLDEPGIALTVDGGPGDDVLDGTPQADTLLGGDGADDLYGNAGDDTLTGGDGGDTIDGGGDDDTIDGGAGDDLLTGGAGFDTIVAGPGADRADGGTEDDHLDTADQEADLVVNCGDGNDTLTFDALDTQIFDCENETASGGGGGDTNGGGTNTTPAPPATPAPSVAFGPVSAITAHGARIDVTVERNPEPITLSLNVYPSASGCDPATGNATPPYPTGAQHLTKIAPPSGVQQTVSFDLSGLPANAAVGTSLGAQNSAGSVVIYGGVVMFTTGAEDGSQTSAADVTATTATLRGFVTPGWIESTQGDHGYLYSMSTSWRFEFGRTKAYGSEVGGWPQFQTTNYCPQYVWFPMTGLLPATTYHYRVRRDRNQYEKPECIVVDPLTGCPLSLTTTYHDYGADVTFTTSTSQVSSNGHVAGGGVILTSTCELRKPCSGKGKITVLSSCRKGAKACPRAASAAAAPRPVLLAKGRFRVRGKGHVRLKLTAAGRRATKGTKKLEARLTLTVPSPKHGKAITTSQAVTLRR